MISQAVYPEAPRGEDGRESGWSRMCLQYQVLQTGQLGQGTQGTGEGVVVRGGGGTGLCREVVLIGVV